MKVNSFFGAVLSDNCSQCKISCRTPAMSYSGEGKKKILILTGYPSHNEDRKGRIFSGTTGEWIRKKLHLLGYDLDKDFWSMPVVGCTHSKQPTKTIIKRCQDNVQKAISKLKPKAVFIFGSTAIDSVLGEWLHTTSDIAMSGNMIPMLDEKYWAFPLLSIRSAMQKEKDPNYQAYFLYTLKLALEKSNSLPKLPKINYVKPVKILTKPKDIISELENFLDDLYDNPESTAFDYETSGLNPFIEGHIITCVSISTKDKCISFPIDYPDAYESDDDYWDMLDLLKEYLENPDFLKIAHRAQFEYIWSILLLDIEPQNLVCTKLNQHILDNRQGITGLKHQAFVRWGIKDYDKSAEPYIKSKNNSSFNTMHKMPLPDQLMYCGIDSYLEIILYHEQMRELKEREIPLDALTFFNNVNNMFAEIQINGIHVDMSFYAKEKKSIEEKIINKFQLLFESQEVISYINKTGNTNFSFTSNDDVRDFFYNHLRLNTDKETTNGQKSVEAEALLKTDHWIAKELIEIRKLTKIKDTYIAQFEREVIDRMLHPSFSLDIPRSLRSSSFSPNFQNIPKREQEAKRITRSGLKPSKGNRLLELDFSGAEVITSSGYHQDPNFIRYLEDEHSDMHQDNAADLWCTDSNNVSKMVRFYAKNCWTFPQFYGDWFGSCAIALWEHRHEKLIDGRTCLESLRDNGIKGFNSFKKHCAKVENKMWKERFKIYDKWKIDMQKEYQKNLFVSTYLSFQFIGYMDKKQVTNYPIQGTSFHLLLKVLLKIRAWLKKNNMKTKIIGQIHDSGIFDSPENEFRNVIRQFQKYTAELYDEYEWLPVRMEAEADVSLKDGDFGHLFEFNPDDDIAKAEKEAKEKWLKEAA